MKTQKMKTLREAIDQPRFRKVRNWLRNYEGRSANSSFSDHQLLLSQSKSDAVSVNDQLTAKAMWCLETIGRIQEQFESSFLDIRSGKFMSAWNRLESCEIAIHFLDKNFTEKDGEFGVEHARVHTRQFQDLLPYKWGISPGYLRTDIRCTICDTKWTLRKRCVHKEGEIYEGKRCGKKICKFQILELALVENPAQKYSVVNVIGDDDPRFEVVKFVVDALKSPWHCWSFHKEELRQYNPAFQNVERSDLCPCGSTLLYENCCLKMEKVMPHFQITFYEETQIELPRLRIYPGREHQDKES